MIAICRPPRLSRVAFVVDLSLLVDVIDHQPTIEVELVHIERLPIFQDHVLLVRETVVDDIDHRTFMGRGNVVGSIVSYVNWIEPP